MPLLGLIRSLNRNLTYVRSLKDERNAPWSHREVLMTHVKSEPKLRTGASTWLLLCPTQFSLVEQRRFREDFMYTPLHRFLRL